MKRLTLNNFFLKLALLLLLSICVIFFALTQGSEPISVSAVFKIILGKILNNLEGADAYQTTIILQVRLPRIILSFFVGMALSTAGVVFQSLLRNPLAEPHLIGVSSGAALGTVIFTIYFMSIPFFTLIGAPFFSFIGAFFAMSLIYKLSLRNKVLSVYTLLLVGVIMNSFFVSIIIFIQSIVSADQLMNIFSWLLGSFSYVEKQSLFIVAIVVSFSVLFLLSKAHLLNLVALGEKRAITLGVNVEWTKKICFLVAALMTGVVVSVSGLIGFIGLVVPHISRLIFGADHRLTLPSSGFIGAILLVLADTVARTLISPREIPVGVITSFLGAPFFIFLLHKKESKNFF